VLLLADMLTPADGVVRLVDLLNGDVNHEAVGCDAVPVVLVRLEEGAVG
jgi:hypothetical protein